MVVDEHHRVSVSVGHDDSLSELCALVVKAHHATGLMLMLVEVRVVMLWSCMKLRCVQIQACMELLVSI